MRGVIPLKIKEWIHHFQRNRWYPIAFHESRRHNVKKGRITVPGKLSKDLNPDTERDILRQAGLKR